MATGDSFADRREARAAKQQAARLAKLARRGKIRVQPERAASSLR